MNPSFFSYLAVVLLPVALLSSSLDYENEDPNELHTIDSNLIWKTSSSADYVDLEKDPQDFILDVKKIEIESCHGAFNPSIIRWNDSLLFSFRIRDPITNSTFNVGLTFLDEQFNPIGKNYTIQMRLPKRQYPSKVQDPRLIIHQGNLLMVYSNILDEAKETRRMYVAQVHFDGSDFYVDSTEYLENYPCGNPLRWEKNWVPFIYEDTLLLAYSLVPHHILRPIWGTGQCITEASSIGMLQWSWGVLRGGTQAFLVDGEYLSFFHSSINMASVHSEGKVMQHYFMGAYTFSPKPPFGITRISKEPIVGKKFYVGPAHKTWKPLRVVFPGGFVFDEKHIWVVYGRQDHELWVAKLDKKGLLNSLIPVSSY